MMKILFDTKEEAVKFLGNSMITVMNSEEGEKVQKKLFFLGFVWKDGKQYVMQDCKYLLLHYHSNKNTMTYINNYREANSLIHMGCATNSYDADFILSITINDNVIPIKTCSKKVWISGNKTYGQQIIKYFKSLGGKNIAELSGTNENAIYFIEGGSDNIRVIRKNNDKDYAFTRSLVMENWKELSVNDILPKTKNVHTFDKVLVRDDDDEDWFPAFFAEFRDCTDEPYVTTEGSSFKQCIPFDENILESQLNKGTGPCTRRV